MKRYLKQIKAYDKSYDKGLAEGVETINKNLQRYSKTTVLLFIDRHKIQKSYRNKGKCFLTEENHSSQQTI